MEWIADPIAGAWLRERLEAPSNDSTPAVVPRGFAARARVFHPVGVRSLPWRTMPAPDEWERMSSAEQERLIGLLVDEPTTWADAASAFGTTMHPLAQWPNLIRTPQGEDWSRRIAPDGREFIGPDAGQLDPDTLALIAGHLATHTATPDSGVSALWDGWGDLLGHVGDGPSRALFALGGAADPNHRAMLERSAHDPFNNVFLKPTWQEGILSREVSEAPRLELAGRGYVQFTASARELCDPDWVLRAPWRDVAAEEHGFAPGAYSPSILWPEDRAWVLVSDVDLDSTVVAGSVELISRLCADDRLEALPIDEDADLGGDADGVNR